MLEIPLKKSLELGLAFLLLIHPLVPVCQLLIVKVQTSSAICVAVLLTADSNYLLIVCLINMSIFFVLGHSLWALTFFFGSHLNLFLVPFLQCLSNGSLASGIVYFFYLIDHYIW
jgi:hypothetical protein